MDIDTLLLFLAATMAVNISPGPSILYVSTIAASGGLRTAVISVLGMSVGILVHVVATATGVAALIAASTTAFMVLKYLGASYLIYLGLRLWFSGNNETLNPTLTARDSTCGYFWRGIIIDLANPKIGLFFLAFLPQFVVAGESGAFTQTLFLGSVFIVAGGIVNICIAAVTVRGIRLVRPRIRTWGERWVPGAILLGLGARLAAEQP